MKLTEILNEGRLTLSFEVFPPKSSSSFDSVKAACEKIAALGPAFVSVTYGAGGGTSEYTFDVARDIKCKFGVPTVAHLTCISSTKKTVSDMISRIKAEGIENVMALRGDIPEGTDPSVCEYRHASELVAELRESGADFCIGAACYPEVHPESASREEDVKYLKQKVDAGVDFLTTQLFFDNPLFYSFMYRLRESGITVPVIPGIMPITSKKQVERVVFLSGSYMPKRFLNLLDKFGSDDKAMKQAGIVYATEQIVDLYANGIKNVHVYTMNNPDVAARILTSVSDIVGK